MQSHEMVISRIKRMELYFDMLSRAVEEGICVHNDPPLKSILEALIAYYESGQWLSDYNADERGELPNDLKRGVLSEDGVYNLLSELDSKSY